MRYADTKSLLPFPRYGSKLLMLPMLKAKVYIVTISA